MATGAGGAAGGGSDPLCTIHRCGGQVVNVESDPHHCGACDNDCGPYAVCHGGACESPGTPCTTCGNSIQGGNLGGDPFCHPSSYSLFAALMQCSCAGACSSACASACACGEMLGECLLCLEDEQNGCGAELAACAADL